MISYKPYFLGQIIPADNESKLTDFVEKKFDAFNDIYDACKKYSDEISSISNVSYDCNDLSVKLTCSTEVMEKIKNNNLNDKLTVSLDVITAKTF